MEQLVNFIIRPPRADYSPKDDLLDQEFMLKGRWFQKKDLEVINGRGNVLRCSHYMPLVIPEGHNLPCVIYCHGNSGCRADASEAAIILLPSNITVFTLDFSGSGLSDGEHVTLGWYEKDDLRAVVNYLRTDGNVSCIGLWGRSMGAVTSLMYGAEDPSIAGMVLDSPFSNLVDLMMELVDTYKYPLPKFTVKLAIQHMRKVIKKKAKFDIMDLDTIQVAKCCFVPVLFGHATDDDFIRPHHSDRIYNSYVGDKNIIKFDGDHNSPRPQFYFDSITIFFLNILNPPKDVPDEQYFHTMHDYFDKGTWDNMHQESRSHNFMGPSPGLASGSTEDAITELRSRRPMSRTEVPPDISSEEKRMAEAYGTDGPSSSRLFSEALPNGHSHNQLMPTIEDEYVEYYFDNLSDIPSNMEDEERMLREAIMESLKGLDMKHSEGDVQSNTSRAADDPSSDSMTTSTAEVNGLSTEPSDSSVSVSPGSKTAECIPDTIESCAPVGSLSVKNSASSSGSYDSAQSSVCGNSSTERDAGNADGTRATLVVQKNPATHIIEGLAQRWRLNFFKSNR